MSHFGLKGALPVVPATPKAEKVFYGLYEWQGRQHYDGGGSNKWETLLAVHEDVDVLRQQMNTIWESSDLFEIRGKYQMVFKEGEFETNTWYHDGGGCAARGGYRIKPIPSLSQHLTKLQQKIDDAQTERDKRAEEQRQREEAEELKKVLEAERIAYWAKRKVINEKHRAWRAANKDEVNAKQRAYRKAQRLKKQQEQLEKARIHDAFMAEWKAWKAGQSDADANGTRGDNAWTRIWNKYYGKAKK